MVKTYKSSQGGHRKGETALLLLAGFNLPVSGWAFRDLDRALGCSTATEELWSGTRQSLLITALPMKYAPLLICFVLFLVCVDQSIAQLYGMRLLS